MTSINTALAAAGYTKAPSPFFGCREILKDGASVGHFDCQTAWSLPGMREVEDRIAAEDMAFSRAPSYCRRTEAGIRHLLVERDGVEMFLPLLELTSVELARFTPSV